MAKIPASEYDMLPHSREDEEALIGSILIDPDAILRARDVDLQPEDFWNTGLSWVYQAARDLADDYQGIDFLAIVDKLQNRKAESGKTQLEAFGGGAELTRMINACPTSIHAQHYAQRVKDYSCRRKIISATGKIAGLAWEFDGSTDDLYDEASKVFYASIQRQGGIAHLRGGEEALQAYLVLQ